MSNYSLELDFQEVPLFGEGTATIQRAHIALKQWTTSETGTPRISAECASAAEVQENVNRLKAELDAIAAKAKQKFR